MIFSILRGIKPLFPQVFNTQPFPINLNLSIQITCILIKIKVFKLILNDDLKSNFLFYLDYPTSKHLNDSPLDVPIKPPSSPSSTSLSSDLAYAKHHMENNGNNWTTGQYAAQSQQYSLSSLCQAASVPSNIPLDYHQSYSNASTKYWS